MHVKFLFPKWFGRNLADKMMMTNHTTVQQLCVESNYKHSVSGLLKHLTYTVLTLNMRGPSYLGLTRSISTGDPLHSRAACTQPCNVNTQSRAHCSPGAQLCEQWGHSCVNNGARLCASARLCRGSPVISLLLMPWLLTSPGHQQPWYWRHRIYRSSSYLSKDLKYLWQITVEEWHKMQIYVYVPSEKFSM